MYPDTKTLCFQQPVPLLTRQAQSRDDPLYLQVHPLLCKTFVSYFEEDTLYENYNQRIVWKERKLEKYATIVF